MMWVEARKQERKIKGMLVDFRKRAERRKDYYEKSVKSHVLFACVETMDIEFISHSLHG